MKLLVRVFAFGYGVVALLFGIAAIGLVAFAAAELWTALVPAAGSPVADRAAAVVDSIALLAIALVAFEIAQTIVEEEIVREAHVSAPTRVRRFLSRFLVVVVVALSIETLVAVFKVMHDDPTRLPYASALGVAAAALLAAWGLFIRLNRYAEDLEPEALERAKSEDAKLD